MKEPQNIVLINGKKAVIHYNKSSAEEFTIEKANLQTVDVINELLKGADSNFKHSEGITTMRELTTLDGFNMKITRISNHLGIVRFYLPINSVFTYQVLGDKYPKFAVAKRQENINALEDLRLRILKKLGKK